MIKVAIAEDHQSLIDGIELLLKYEEDIALVGTANDGKALLQLVHNVKPDVILMDIKMPKIDGITATGSIITQYPTIGIIAFSMFDQEDAIKQMIKAGARGYLLKNSPLEEVLTAIRAVHGGGTFFDKAIDPSYTTTKKNISSNKSILSKSEREILTLIGKGKTTSEIAAARFTAVSTVEKHRKNMIRKLGLSGKGELLRYALEKKYDF
ncbi:response regulator transcription factor [Rasiella sp. SM2506]|uniref:response regulator transcription factor n=1 Tax=Rasiella sp. SM2506 TaxID=3423914 RepID=UPI003D7C066B